MTITITPQSLTILVEILFCVFTFLIGFAIGYIVRDTYGEDR